MKFFRLIPLLLVLSTATHAQPPASKARARLNHVAIYVVDLAKTKAFYESLFGFDSIPEPFHDGKHAWYRIAPGVALHVIQGADKPKEYFLNQHTCFSVSNTEAFVTMLKTGKIDYYNSKGVKGEVTTRVDGIKQVWVNDPDGYWIEVNDAKE